MADKKIMPDKTEPTIDQIAAAMAEVDGRTPSEVINAFLPLPQSKLGRRLVPITAGHELALAQLGHPLSTGSEWDDSDVLMALFLFTRPSREVFAMIADDTFQAEFFAFIDSIPSSDIAKLGHDMAAHWMRSRATALAMEASGPGGQKKTADLVGFSAPSQQRARLMDGLRKWFSTTFRSAKSSP